MQRITNRKLMKVMYTLLALNKSRPIQAAPWNE
jgi:hypothetical protein